MAVNPFDQFGDQGGSDTANPFAQFDDAELGVAKYGAKLGKRIKASWEEQAGGLVTGAARGLRTPQTFADRVRKEYDEIKMRDLSLGEFARASAETIKAPFDIVLGAPIEEAAQGVTDLLPGESRDRALDEMETIGQGMYDRGQQHREAAGEFNIRRPDGFEAGQGIKYYGTQALESLGANMGPAMAVGVLSRGRTVSLNNVLSRRGIKNVDEEAMTTIGGLGTMGAQVYGAEYERAFRETGGNQEAAIEQATVRMFAEVIPEIIPFGFAMKAAGPLTKAVKELGGFKAAAAQIVGGTLTEGASEVLTEVINESYDVLGLGKELNFTEFKTQMTDAFIVGALMGAGMNAPAVAGEAISQVDQWAEARVNKNKRTAKLQPGIGQPNKPDLGTTVPDLGTTLDANPAGGGFDLNTQQQVGPAVTTTPAAPVDQAPPAPPVGIQPPAGPAAALEEPPVEQPVANPFAQFGDATPPLPAAVDQLEAAPTPPAGPRWNADRGSIPGEPLMYLDGDADTATAAIIERPDDQGGVLYEAVDGEGQSLGIAETVEEAARIAEQRFPEQAVELQPAAVKPDDEPLNQAEADALVAQALAEVEAEQAAEAEAAPPVPEVEAPAPEAEEATVEAEEAPEAEETVDSLAEQFKEIPESGVYLIRGKGKAGVAAAEEALTRAGYVEIPFGKSTTFVNPETKTTAFTRSQGKLAGVIVQFGKAKGVQLKAAVNARAAAQAKQAEVLTTTEEEQGNDDVSRQETGAGRERGQEGSELPAAVGEQSQVGSGSEAAGQEEGLTAEGEGEVAPPSARDPAERLQQTIDLLNDGAKGVAMLALRLIGNPRLAVERLNQAAGIARLDQPALADVLDEIAAEVEKLPPKVKSKAEPEAPPPAATDTAVETDETDRAGGQKTTAEAAKGLRYDPAKNEYDGQKLVRGDVLKGAEGKEYSVDRVAGFMLTLDELNDDGTRSNRSRSASVDPTDTDRYMELTRAGRNVFEPAAQPEATPEPTPEPETAAEPEAQTPEPAAKPEPEVKAEPDQTRKLENTGVDLRRHWEQMKADLEASKSDGERTWSVVDAQTQRGKLFRPEPGTGATPGVQRYYDDLRSNLITFGEVMDRWWNLGRTKGKWSTPRGTQIAEQVNSREHRYNRDSDPPNMQALLLDAAREYSNMMRLFSEAMSGARTVEEAEKLLSRMVDTTQFPAMNWDKMTFTEEMPKLTLANPWRPENSNKFTPITESHPTRKIRGFVINRKGSVDNEVGNSTPRQLNERFALQHQATDKTTKKALTRTRLDEVSRNGKEVRTGNVTPAQMKAEFGFADIGFGKWVPKRRDQKHLNAAWDSFADLADRLGIPRKAIGFYGKLHFTIGALGKGRHAAHFSPNHPHPNGSRVAVINVTNTSGDGTVAHEWGHALDWLAMRDDFNAASVMSTILRELSSIRTLEGVRARTKAAIRSGSYMERSGPRGSVQNVTALVRYYASTRGNTTDYKRNALALGKDYWAKPHELFARAFEAHIYDTLEGENNYLVNEWVGDGVITKPAYRGNPYPAGEERAHFGVVLDALIAGLKTEGDAVAIDKPAFIKALPAEIVDFDNEVQKIVDEVPEMIAEWEAEKAEKAKAKIQADQQEQAAKWRAAAEQAAAEQRLRDAERQAEEDAKAEQAAAGDIASGIDPNKPLNQAEADALVAQALAELAEEAQEQPDVAPIMTAENKDEVPEEGTKAPSIGLPTEPKVRAALKEAAELGVEGMEDVLRGLAKLFPPNKLHSFPPTIDPDHYAKAKPYFEAGLTKFQQAGQTLIDLTKYLIKHYGAALAPYISHWIKAEGLSNNLTVNKMPDIPAPPAGTLAEFMFQRVSQITDNNKLKAALEEYLGHAPSEAEIKTGQEALELALVRTGMGVMSQGLGRAGTFKALFDIYEQQPNLNSRSSTSMENQAYSTPLPLAYLASELAGINSGSRVYEPTAGNGALLLGANPAKAAVNELNAARADNLRTLSYHVTENDATTWKPGVGFDAVIMNPPFGSLGEPTKVDGYTVSQIDHLIAAKALEAMTDNGRATLILGANMKAGETSKANRIFFNWLYSHYNVVDHFEVAGGLYRKQGAGWPVVVITVKGRAASNRVFDQQVQRLDNWSAINEHVQGVLDSARFTGRAADGAVDTGGPAQDAPGASEQTGGAADQTGKTGGRGAGTGRGATSGADDGPGRVPGTGTESQPPRRSGDDAGIGSDAQPGDPGKQSGARGQESAPAKDVPGSQLRGEAGSTDSGDLGSDYQVEYQPASRGLNEKVLVPVNMRTAMETAMRNLREAVGDIDQFVMKKLGYSSLADMHSSEDDSTGFMALQVDAIAASIYNLEKNNRGVIIADQTGVGKGRQAAGMIRYALRNDMVPVFVTAQANLFTDMYDDLLDIGETGAKPFIFNSSDSQGGGFIVDRNGGKNLFANKPAARKAGLEALARGEMPDGANMLMLTYSQGQVDNIQRRALAALTASGKKPLFIFDESHTVAGVRTTKDKVTKKPKPSRAGFFFNLIESQPVLYLSATFAKRPDNMPIFYRTNLMDAVDSVDDLEGAIAAGGEALQMVVSSMLAQDGQLWRRERSFAGISFDTVTFGRTPEGDVIPGTEAMTAKHIAQADAATKGLREIVSVDKMFAAYFEEEGSGAQDIITTLAGAGGVGGHAGGNVEMLMQHSPFTSIVHNFVSQLLMSMKAEWIVEEAIAMQKAGYKPVIALKNTMQSFLEGEIERGNAVVGKPWAGDYRSILHAALERTRRITLTDAKGEDTRVTVPLELLPAHLQLRYKEAAKLIDGLPLKDIVLFYIDYIRHKLEEAKITTGEITGRTLMVDYSTEPPTVRKRPDSAKKHRRLTINGFNNGSIDALVLNEAGSTGLSIHASEKFKDKKPRHMMVAQAIDNINTLMQMLGRINRTGQVVVPRYSMLGLDLPSEQRPLAMTARKMRSLSANTSANTDSETSLQVAALLNKYGDQTAKDMMLDTPDYQILSGLSIDADTEDSGLALKFTGKMALAPDKDQRAMWADFNNRYTLLIEMLDATGQNDLDTTVVDLDARIIENKVIYEGKDPTTIFGGNTVLHKITAKVQGRPPTAHEVMQTITESLGDKTAQGVADEILAGAEASADKVLDELSKEKDEIILERQKVSAKNNAEAELAKVDARLLEVNGKINKQREKVQQFREGLDTYQIGTAWKLDLGTEVVTGVVVAVTHVHHEGQGDPYSPSKLRIKFMVNSPAGRVPTPFSKILAGGFVERGLYLRDPSQIVNLFNSAAGTSARETRYIATGNLLGGYSKVGGHGRVVPFTAANGRQYYGILMPHAYGKDGEYDRKDDEPVVVRKWEEAAAYLRGVKNDDGLSAAGLYNLPLQEVRVSSARYGGKTQYAVSVWSKRSAASDAVKFDKRLHELMGGEFVGRGQVLTVQFDESKLDAVLERLTELTTLYVPGSGFEALQKITGRTALDATVSFDGSAKDDESLRENWDDERKGTLLDSGTPDDMAPRFDRADVLTLGFEPTRTKSGAEGKITFFTQQLEAAMGRFTGEIPVKGTYKQVTPPGDLLRAVRAIEKAFGRRVVFFRQDHPYAFPINGVALPRDPKTIYINIDSKNPFRGVLGHELLHTLRQTDPELYNKLATIAWRRLKRDGLARFTDAKNGLIQRSGSGVDLSEDKMFEEMVANVVGDAFLDPAFLEELSAEGETFFNRLLNAIVQILQSFQAKMQQRGMGTTEYFTDVDALIAQTQTLLRNYRPRQPAQARDVTAGDPSFEAAEGETEEQAPAFSRSTPTNMTPDQQEFAKRAGMDPDKRSLADRTKDLLAASWVDAKQALSDSIQMGLFDKFYGIKRAYRDYLGEQDEAHESGYIAARLSTGSASVMRGVLLHGAPEYRDGIIQKVPGSVGLLDVFKPIQGELDQYLLWAIARRADRLYAEGKENNFTRDQIDAGLQFAAGTITIDGQTRNRADVYGEVAEEFAEFKGRVLDLAEAAGLIDAITRPVWDKADWIPFYRVNNSRQDGGVKFGGGMGLSRQSSGIRKLVGGTEKLSDPLGNIVMNFNHLIQASMKNMALLKTVDALDGTTALKKEGMAMRKALVPRSEIKRMMIADGIDESTIEMLDDETGGQIFEGIARMWALAEPAGKEVVKVMRDGKPEYYRINDPMLLKSLTNVDIERISNLFMDIGRASKTLLTTMVTAEPSFMFRNFTRDTLHAWVINEDHFIPIYDSVRGLWRSGMESGGMLDMMFAGGSFQGGYINGTDPEAARKSIRTAMRKKKYPNEYIEKHLDSVIDTTAGVWDKWRQVGDAIENANREAVYEAATKAGKSKAQAIFEAKDLMDFSMHGSWRWIQMFMDLLPFFNARLQGLYKLGRSGAVPIPGLIAKEIAMRGLWIALASVALAWINDDNEEYQALEDWDKDTYWHLFPGTVYHFRIPKPFEVGVIYGTIPERMYRAALGKDTPEKFFSRMGHAIMDTLAADPYPQAVKPALEVWANQSRFTKRPIENMGDERQMPRSRYNASTSDTMVAIGPFLEKMGLSPKQGEHLLRGYLGTLGSYALDAADRITRDIMGRAPVPAESLRDWSVLGSLYRGKGPAWNTRYGTELYEMHREITELWGTVKAYEERNLGDRAKSLVDDPDNQRKLSVRQPIAAWSRQRGKMRDEIDAIYQNETMTPEEKRDRIGQVIEQRNKMDREAYKYFSPMFDRK